MVSAAVGRLGSRTLRLAVALAALAAIQAASASHNPRSFPDPTGDSGSAFDISGVTVSNTAAGKISIRIDIANAPAAPNDDNGIGVFVDADRNASTGPEEGYEYTLQSAGTRTFVGRWDGSAYTPVPTTSFVYVWRGGQGATLEISRADLGNTAGFKFFAVSEVLSGTDEFFDDTAPDGIASFEYALSTPHATNARARYSPAAPRAGRRFRVSAVTVTLETREQVQATSFRCRATLARRTLRGTGAGRCTFALPRSARGKRLVVVTTGSVGGQTATARSSFRVR